MTGLFRYPKRKLRKLANNGEYRKALEFGDSIEQDYSRDPDFLFIMGSIYYMIENADSAIHYFDRVLQINDSDIDALWLKANAHLSLGETGDVCRCCDRILEVDPDHNGAKEILEDL